MIIMESKTLSKLLLGLIFIFSFSSCKKPIATSLIGDWYYSITDVYSEQYYTREIEAKGEISFYEDGSGLEINAIGELYPFVWSLISSKELKLQYDGQQPYSMLLLEDKKKRKEWIKDFVAFGEQGELIDARRVFVLTKDLQ